MHSILAVPDGRLRELLSGIVRDGQRRAAGHLVCLCSPLLLLRHPHHRRPQGQRALTGGNDLCSNFSSWSRLCALSAHDERAGFSDTNCREDTRNNHTRLVCRLPISSRSISWLHSWYTCVTIPLHPTHFHVKHSPFSLCKSCCFSSCFASMCASLHVLIGAHPSQLSVYFFRLKEYYTDSSLAGMASSKPNARHSSKTSEMMEVGRDTLM